VDDPVSWLMITPGWKVYASDGTEVGEVDEIAGDESHDIFDGLAVATTALGRPKYVPAEKVTTITEGRVNLSLTRAEVEGAGDYLEPATEAQIEPDSKGGLGEALGADLRELAGKAIHPVERQKPVGLVRRVYLLIHRKLGR
jgi:hypothetical protein